MIGRLGAVAAVVAAAWVGEPAAYRGAQLRCAAFSETIRTFVRGASGTATVQTRAGRQGVVVVAARDSTAGTIVDVWYDSLVVWRESGGEREQPELDGFLGGRYRGLLAPDGGYSSIRDPFVPAEVAEVADLATAMDDFFPRLPPVELARGKTWSDSGRTVRRLADRRDPSGPLARYEWTLSARRGERYPAADTLAVVLDQVIEERGELLWSDRFGPQSWTRRIVVTARIPATGGVRRSIRSVVEQEIDVVRRYDLDPNCR